MATVRYYGRDHDPSTFTGWRGFVIRATARLIDRLTRSNEKRVMRYIMREQDFPKEAQRTLSKAFDEESSERKAIAAFKELTDSELIRQKPRDSVDRHERKNTQPKATKVDRTVDMFAAYSDGGRGGRYIHKRTRRFADPDGDVQAFTALEAE